MNLKRKVLRSFPIAFVFLALLLPAAVPTAAFAASADHLVTQISLAPRTPNILRLNQSVTINFSYSTTEAGGVRIFARLMSGGVLTPHYAASGAALSPVGTGTGSQSFTITSGNATVDQIRFQMWDAGQTTLLRETFVPVNYQFTSAANNVLSQIKLTATPNVLKPGQRVSISFDYKAKSSGGAYACLNSIFPITPSSISSASSTAHVCDRSDRTNPRHGEDRGRILFEQACGQMHTRRKGTAIMVHEPCCRPAGVLTKRYGEVI